tara:strand:- start:2306 stop:2485 length:180 start_codon:yes stop_codon:yes gene_type:complete
MVSRKIHVSWYAWASALMPQKVRKKPSEAVSEKKVKPSSDTDKDNDDRQKRKRRLSVYA